MKVYKFKREILLPVSIDKAWSFFSDPWNLKVITPPEMNFTILTANLPENIYSGLQIEYSVTPLLGIKTKWITIIRQVNAPYFFTDEQESGPYSLWKHKHVFTETNEGTLMSDEIEYAIPFSFLGIIANLLVIRRKLNKIFNFRTKIIKELFSPENIPVA